MAKHFHSMRASNVAGQKSRQICISYSSHSLIIASYIFVFYALRHIATNCKQKPSLIIPTQTNEQLCNCMIQFSEMPIKPREHEYVRVCCVSSRTEYHHWLLYFVWRRFYFSQFKGNSIHIAVAFEFNSSRKLVLKRK